MIAVCLLTCDRVEYTRRTLESFARHNPDRSRFVLLHADDASRDGRNAELAGAAGFATLVQHTARAGNLATRIALLEAAAAGGAEWVLVLENDCESVRPFPWPLFDFCRRQKHVYCLRLFGKYKDADKRQPCKTINQWAGLGSPPVIWTKAAGAPEPAEVGIIHWTAQPAVTRTRHVLAIHRDRVRRKLGLTVRVLENVFHHIGLERTNPRGADKPLELGGAAC